MLVISIRKVDHLILMQLIVKRVYLKIEMKQKIMNTKEIKGERERAPRPKIAKRLNR